uniref:Protein sidekick n=1 Tax=Timema bartmani TaxID=61472 RepID=A0A7R9F6X0_9NEOP|nr:unnamed protein product [Timema bartmani]
MNPISTDGSGITCCYSLFHNSLRVLSPSSPLDVAQTSTPVMETPPQNITILDGKDATLACRAVGAPTPNITWTYQSEFDRGLRFPALLLNPETLEGVDVRGEPQDGRPVDMSGRVQVLEQGDLLIAAVKETDAGGYTCVRANEAGLVTASGYLSVLGVVLTEGRFVSIAVRTQIIQPPVDTRVLLGQTATLQCKVSSDPTVPFKVIWRRNEEEIDTRSSKRISIQDDGTLEIAAVRASDVADYTCSVFSPGGNETRSARLSVIELPYAPVNVKAVRLDTRSQRAVNVSWTSGFDGNSPVLKFIVQKREVGDLVLLSTSKYNFPEHIFGIPVRARAMHCMPILARAVVAVTTGPIADPLPTWVTALSNVSADGPRWVLLTALKAAATYQFRVSAVNSVGEGSASKPSNTVALPQERKATFERYSGSMASLVLTDSSQLTADSQQLAPSGPPLGFVGSARSQSEIITQWQPPQEELRNGQILGYVIRYRLYGYDTSPWTYQNITNEAQRTYLIKDLITWKDYILQIAAFNNMGAGVYGDSVKIKTKEGGEVAHLISRMSEGVKSRCGLGEIGVRITVGSTEGVFFLLANAVPEAPPSLVRVQAINSTAVEVWWEPPNPQKINGINQGYKLQAWIGDPSTSEHDEVSLTVPPSLMDPLAEQSAVVGGLDKFTEYNVTVLCFTDPGDGRRSPPVTIRTDEDVPAEVGSLHFDDVSDRAVKVLWTPPKQVNGVLRGYQLRYSVKDRPETLLTRNLTEDTLSVMVEHLQATTHYRFEVSAWTNVGVGPPRVATIQSGIEPVLPEPPTKLAVSNIEAFSVVLQFTPGFDGNSSITRWTVEAQTVRNATWFTLSELSDPDATTLTVAGLVPFTQYKLRLTASNVVGPSEPSEPTKEFQTIQAPPAHPPRNVTVRAMSATELRVRWIYSRVPSPLVFMYNPVTKCPIALDSPAPAASGVVRQPQRVQRVVQGGGQAPTTQRLHRGPHGQLPRPRQDGGVCAILIIVQAFNDVGTSLSSPVAVERTRESVPSFGPMNVEANATSSTTIVVRWGDVPKEHQNGLIEGFKVYYGSHARSFQYKNIPSNTTFTTTLTELRKFVQYHIQVLAYTRLGDGALSTPPVRVQTFEDAPGAPSNVSFPDVSLSMARIIWDVPEEPNGEILAYRVSYHLQSASGLNYTREFPPSDRTYRVTELEAEQYYMFSVTAQTRLGWGKTAHALVYTTNNRERPQQPSVPQISRSQVQAEQITFSWTPGRDGFAPLRYYTVQYSENSGPWQTVPERVDPQVTSYTVADLKPFTSYMFRIQATNDIGPSGWSPESSSVQTLPAAPSKGVSSVKVVPITTTSVKVQWEPVEKAHWNGDHQTGGYQIVFQPVSDYPTALQATPKKLVPGITVDQVVLSDLTRDKNYEMVVVPYNSQGSGPPSPPVTVYVGEAVPTGEPREVTGEAVSPTEVRLRWTPPEANQQNGDLLGYKINYILPIVRIETVAAPNIWTCRRNDLCSFFPPSPQIFYLMTETSQDIDGGRRVEEELEVVPASYSSHSLVFLDKFTEYRVEILAFNPAGDGPRSAPITIRTLQGLPGPPRNLTFLDITMSSLKVSWKPPKNRNGEIIGYVVTYETAKQNESFSKQVKQKVSGTSLLIQSLEEEITYTFWVRAQTIDLGPPVSGNVTTGPQEGSPMRPKELVITKSVSSVDLHWVNGPSGKGPILGYYIQSQKKGELTVSTGCWVRFPVTDGVKLSLVWSPDEKKWQTIIRSSNGPLQEFTISYQNLLPSTSYTFRVITYNKYGISYPSASNEAVLTPSKLYLEYGYLQQKPFYRQTWFMVTLAAASIVVIIMIIAILCVKSKSYKYKQEAQKTLEESMAMDVDERQDLRMELYRSHRAGSGGATMSAGGCGTLGKRGTLCRKSLHQPPGGPTMLGKSPPRPSPASVAYHSDEESLKGYDENPDDSSVTEKHSEISSTDSQASESENDSERSDPHSFVNHYANINDSLRQSWEKQKPVRNYSSYTDSEPEGSAVMSLNGGQIIMNNMARSRAPLPGFSSFV